MDLKETIENALYSMGKFTTDECSEMAENLQFSIEQEAGQVDAIVMREVIMNIEEGWRFQSADFSVQASGKDNATGFVRLVRSPAEKTQWHKMSEDMKEDDNGPPLYVIGHGMTLEDAIISANLAAAHAKPISV